MTRPVQRVLNFDVFKIVLKLSLDVCILKHEIPKASYALKEVVVQICP